MTNLKENHQFIKSDFWTTMAGMTTDQERGIACPPVQQPYPEDASTVTLVPPDELDIGHMSVLDAIGHRQSRRKFSDAALTLEELSFLAWATQGVHKVWRGGTAVRRTVPSAGARHPFESYLVINRVDDVAPGLYRYLSLAHKLCLLRTSPTLPEEVSEACLGQSFVGDSAVAFIWTAIPYRTEWRYSLMTPKLINLDAGHVCQNLYLACEAIHAGTCAVGAYNQKKLDAFLGVDGEEEFAVYVAPVGKR